jgi:hypothetical protein
MANSADFYFSANAKEVVQAINGIQDRLRKLEGEGKKADIGTPLESGFARATHGVSRLKSALAGLGITAMAAGAAAALKNLGGQAIKAAAEMETFATRFTTLMGNADLARDHVLALNKYAAQTPFDMAGISQANASLLAFGVNAEESLEILRMLGDVAAGTGGDLAGLALIYGKANTSGKLDRGDVSQMALRGVNVAGMLAQREGVSAGEVLKGVGRGEYNVQDLKWVLEQLTSEGGAFYKGAEHLSQTFNGQISTLTDNWKMFMTEVGDRLMPVAKSLTAWSGDLLEVWGGPLLGYGKAVVDFAKGFVKYSGEALRILGMFNPIVHQITRSFKLFDYVMLRPFRELEAIERGLLAAQKEMEKMASEALFKTQVQVAEERKLADQARLVASAEELAAMQAERAAKAAKEERQERAKMRSELADSRSRRAAEWDKELFTSQTSEGMRAELAYRFKAATGQEWSGGFGADDVALAAAEDAAAKRVDKAAMAELTVLREYAALYKKTAAEEVDAANKKAEALEKARVAEIDAAEVADATARGDHATAQRIQAEGTARSKFAELLRLGMSQQEAAQYAAAHAGRQHGSSTQAGGGEWLRDDLAGIGGGGAARRIPNAQLAIQRQQLTAAQLTNTLLEKLLTLPRSVSIPVTA